jgi:hypothetical protein
MKNWFKNNNDDYKVFYLEEVFVFIICGLLISGFFGVVLSLPHWIAFSIGYPFAFIIIIKKKHKDINNDVKEYLKLINKKK